MQARFSVTNQTPDCFGEYMNTAHCGPCLHPLPAHTPGSVLQEFHKLGCVVPCLPSLPAPSSSSTAMPDSGTAGMCSVAEGWFSGWVGASPSELKRPGGPRGAVRGKSQ